VSYYLDEYPLTIEDLNEYLDPDVGYFDWDSYNAY
jgi:hypothetical protein